MATSTDGRPVTGNSSGPLTIIGRPTVSTGTN